MKDGCGPELDTFWYVTLDFLDDGSVEILWVVPKQPTDKPTRRHIICLDTRRDAP